jgi:hypothetical protein
MNIRLADNNDLSAVARFNSRLKAEGQKEQVTLRINLPGEELHKPEGFPEYRKMMIAEDGQEIRALFLLHHSTLFMKDVQRDFCWICFPLSEGIINRKYAITILQLIRKTLSYQSLLLDLYSGSFNDDWPQLLIKLGWKYNPVPFFFFPVRPTRVLLGLEYIKKHAGYRYGASLGAYSGLGALLRGGLALRRRLAIDLSEYSCSEQTGFDIWADRVFENSVNEYNVAIRRDATTLNILYPAEDSRYLRLRVRRKSAGEDIGWIVALDKQMCGNKYFGDLRVGVLADGFGRASDATALIASGLNHLKKRGVDIVVGNFSHRAWIKACRNLGFLSGPTNFFFFTSPNELSLLEDHRRITDIHLVRGCGDGLNTLI